MEIVKGINTCTVKNDTLECFKELTNEELEMVHNNLVEVTYKKGEVICKQGSFASHVMILNKGLVKVYMEGCHSKEELTIKIIPNVNIIGLPFIYEGNNVFQYSAKAYLECEVQLIEINTFRKLTQSNAMFASKIINLLCENTILVYGRFFCLTKKQTYGRFADILLCLSQRVYKKDTFPLQLTRKELAELAHMSLESTTRIITKFKNESLIDIRNNQVEIHDIEKLTMISNNG